jgi:hypothetical protein
LRRFKQRVYVKKYLLNGFFSVITGGSTFIVGIGYSAFVVVAVNGGFFVIFLLNKAELS